MNAVTATGDPQGMTAADRSAIAKQIMTLFGHWNVDNATSASLLGLAEDNRTALKNYRDGKPLGASRDLLDRAGNLLAIHKNLRLLFPRNRELCYAWMTTPNRAFDGMAPAEVVREHGFSGLLMVRGYLDRARGR